MKWHFLELSNQSSRREIPANSICAPTSRDAMLKIYLSFGIRKMVGFLRRGADFLSYGQQLAPANGCSASLAATSKTRQMSSDSFAVPRSGFAIKRAMISKSHFNKRERCICLRLLGCTLALSRDYSGLSRW